jgi:hypothetical protein
MKRLLLVIGLLFLALAGALGTWLGAARDEGRAMSPPLAAFTAHQCLPRPCWNDIRPGQTTPSDVSARFAGVVARRLGALDGELCWPDNPCWHYTVRSWNQAVGEIMVEAAPGSLRLGDTVRVLGTPLTAQLCYIAGATGGGVGANAPRPLMVAYITFQGSVRVVAYHTQRPLARRIAPDMMVYRLYYQDGYDIYRPRWRGFAQQGRLGCGR